MASFVGDGFGIDYDQMPDGSLVLSDAAATPEAAAPAVAPADAAAATPDAANVDPWQSYEATLTAAQQEQEKAQAALAQQHAQMAEAQAREAMFTRATQYEQYIARANEQDAQVNNLRTVHAEFQRAASVGDFQNQTVREVLGTLGLPMSEQAIGNSIAIANVRMLNVIENNERKAEMSRELANMAYATAAASQAVQQLNQQTVVAQQREYRAQQMQYAMKQSGVTNKAQAAMFINTVRGHAAQGMSYEAALNATHALFRGAFGVRPPAPAPVQPQRPQVPGNSPIAQQNAAFQRTQLTNSVGASQQQVQPGAKLAAMFGIGR